MCDTYFDTLVYICICMSVILSVFLLGRISHSGLELHNMLMTLPIFVSPVWVLDVCLDTAFNCDSDCQFVRTSTTYYDLGDLYGMW